MTKGLVFGACCALVIACASGKRMSASPSVAPTSSDGSIPGANQGMGPREEIQALDREIEAALMGSGIRAAQPPACVASNTCSQATPVAMSVKPAQEDPTCKVGASDTCKDSCTLSDSICKNADRICVLAGQLGGTDAYANETCERGNASCKAARERCCGCL